MDFTSIKFGRIKPPDFEHVRKYPIELIPEFQTPPPMGEVEKILYYPPSLIPYYNQGNSPECAGFAGSWNQTNLNSTADNIKKYNPHWLYSQAQLVDGVPFPHEGTTVRAIGEVLKNKGHSLVVNNKTLPPDLKEGITGYYWAASINGIRSSMYYNVPVLFGIDWWTAMMDVETYNGEKWILKSIPENYSWGDVLGGHMIQGIACSDSRQAVMLLNTWGYDFPPVWIPYTAITRLLNETGECMIVYDRKDTPPVPPEPPTPPTYTRFKTKATINVRSSPSDANTKNILGQFAPKFGPLPIMSTSLDAKGRGYWYKFAGNSACEAWVAGWLCEGLS